MKSVLDDAKNGFAKGLTATFAGKSEFQKITRGTFQMASSSVVGDDSSYIDQWVIGRTTGGQEILEVNGQRFTRVYAGGVISEISALGITHKRVLDYLTSVLVTSANQTRFDEKYTQTDDEWAYDYTPEKSEIVLNLITGKETIFYKKTPVFVHLFIISPIIL